MTTVARSHATLATKRALLLTWAGLPPAGSHQLAAGARSGRDAIFIAPPAQNRTGGFPAYGLYGSFFVKGASRHFCRALLLHSFVRPVPRAFFHPDRTLPSPSRAAAVKDGASSAPPKACP